MDALRNFEKNLKPHEKEYLNSRINFYKEDKTYVQNHQDDPAILATPWQKTKNAVSACSKTKLAKYRGKLLGRHATITIN